MNFVIRNASADPLKTAWGAELRALEARIQKFEGDGLMMRWRFGRWMLQERKGKQFPKGLLDRICRQLKISERELHYRVRFGEKYPTQEEVRNAIADFPSWYQMTQHGLSHPKRARKVSSPPKPVASFELHRIEKLFTKMQPERQTPANIECLRRIHAQLGQVLEAAMRMLAAVKTPKAEKEPHHA